MELMFMIRRKHWVEQAMFNKKHDKCCCERMAYYVVDYQAGLSKFTNHRNYSDASSILILAMAWAGFKPLGHVREPVDYEVVEEMRTTRRLQLKMV